MQPGCSSTRSLSAGPKLSRSDCENLTYSPEALRAAEDVLERFPDNFRPPGREPCKLGVYRITLKDKSKFHIAMPRRVNPIVLADMRKQVQELVNSGVIEAGGRCAQERFERKVTRRVVHFIFVFPNLKSLFFCFNYFSFLGTTPRFFLCVCFSAAKLPQPPPSPSTRTPNMRQRKCCVRASDET